MAYIYTSPSNVIPDSSKTLNGVLVKEYLLSKHNPNKYALPPKRDSSKKIIGVTIHNTEDLVNVEDDGRNYVAATINGNMNNVYVHYYVDELCAWHCMPDKYVSWSCSDGANGSGNTQTICIECVMGGTTGNDNIKAKDNAARLAAYILFQNKLTINDLYTHTYWINMVKGKTSGSRDELCCITPAGQKTCPYYIIPTWTAFKQLVSTYLDALNKAAQELYRVRKSWADAKSQIGAFTNLDSAKEMANYNKGYKVFNSKGKGCYTPKQYYQKAIVKIANAETKATFASKSIYKKLAGGTQVSIYANSEKVDSGNQTWVKIKYDGCPRSYVWIKKSCLMNIK